MSIPHLQLTTSVLWFVTALVLAPGTFRVFFGRVRTGDFGKSALFFAALIFTGGSSRFLLAPDNVAAWKMIYGMSIALALYVWVITWNLRRDKVT